MPPADGQIPPSTRPVASVGRGGPFTAIRDSIELRKERGSEDRRLFAASFDDQSRNRWFWLIAAELGPDGWTAHGVAGGSDGPAGADRGVPTRSEPWLNLCGQWGSGRLYAGGELHDRDANVGRVRLTLADGTQLTDDVEAGVALFVSRVDEEPASVDFFDIHGARIGGHQAF